MWCCKKTIEATSSRPQNKHFYDKCMSLVDTLASVTCCVSCEHFPRPIKTTDCTVRL